MQNIQESLSLRFATVSLLALSMLGLAAPEADARPSAEGVAYCAMMGGEQWHVTTNTTNWLVCLHRGRIYVSNY